MVEETKLQAELIYQADDIVGESLIWDDRQGRLLWVDIIRKLVHSLDPVSGEHQQWETPDFVTCIGLREDGGAVVGLRKTICLWDFDDHFRPLADIEEHMPGNRLNEGVVGPDGAFWCGTMQNNIGPDGQPVDITQDTGSLYRCTADGDVQRVCEDVFGITNTLVWTEDGGLITADTLKNTIFKYAIDPETSRLSDRTEFHAEFSRGLPDGSTSDSDGFLWNCRVVGGQCLLRLNREGEIDDVAELPCSWPTSCAFGGQNLDTLFVTSARFTMDRDHLAANPQEGGLFALKPDARGMPSHRFG